MPHSKMRERRKPKPVIERCTSPAVTLSELSEKTLSFRDNPLKRIQPPPPIEVWRYEASTDFPTPAPAPLLTPASSPTDSLLSYNESDISAFTIHSHPSDDNSPSTINKCHENTGNPPQIATPPNSERDRSHRFWYHDGSIVLKVEDSRYKLHGSLLELHSPFFVREFTSPRLGSGQCRMGSEVNPLKLEGIQEGDFEIFLEVIYPRDYSNHGAFTMEQWVSILIVATKLQFPSIRDMALRHFDAEVSLTAVDHIVLGHKADIEKWLLPAYKELCEREESITLEEGRQLGVDDVVRIMQMRDKLSRSASPGCSWQDIQEKFGVYPIPDFPDAIPR